MSAIAKDQSITLITAIPGSGKTLRVVWYIREALQAKEEVYICNLNGLTRQEPFVGWNEFSNPKEWQTLPAGSVLIVDEAQDFFPAQTGNTPPYIMEMSKIRHHGIRLILITQAPSLLHSHIRQLCGRHEHLVRKNGKQMATVYVRTGTIDNVRSERQLAKEDYHDWAFPTDLFWAYKSAALHTVKRTMPSKYKRAMVMAAVAACMIGYVAYSMKSKTRAAETVAADAALAADTPRARGSALPRIETGEQYLERYKPLLASAPWTMPAMVNREPTVQPEVLCMSAKAGNKEQGRSGANECICLTEQGTVYEMDLFDCHDIARKGPDYNPFRTVSVTTNGQVNPTQAQTQKRDQEAEGRSAAKVPENIALPGAASLPAQYGGFRE